MEKQTEDQSIPRELLLLVTRNATGNIEIASPGRFPYMAVGDLFRQLAEAPDMGRARLLELWPDCAPEMAEKLLAALQAAPLLFGGAL